MAYLKLGRRHWIVLVIALTFVVVVIRGEVRSRHLSEQGKQAHDYLCYQKTYVIPQRIASSLQYSADVQTGKRAGIPGLTVADLQTGVQRDQDTLNALSRVHC